MNIDELLQEGIKQVLKVNIKPGKIDPKVKINSRAKRRFGQCRKVPYGEYDYEIEINEALLKATKEKIMNTLVHEILHTCKGCMNHGKTWKAYAHEMNVKYGYDISTTTSYEAIGIERPAFKYTIECQGCGTLIGRQQRSKLVKQPYLYRCKCGGKLALVE